MMSYVIVYVSYASQPTTNKKQVRMKRWPDRNIRKTKKIQFVKIYEVKHFLLCNSMFKFHDRPEK